MMTSGNEYTPAAIVRCAWEDVIRQCAMHSIPGSIQIGSERIDDRGHWQYERSDPADMVFALLRVNSFVTVSKVWPRTESVQTPTPSEDRVNWSDPVYWYTCLFTTAMAWSVLWISEATEEAVEVLDPLAMLAFWRKHCFFDPGARATLMAEEVISFVHTCPVVTMKAHNATGRDWSPLFVLAVQWKNEQSVFDMRRGVSSLSGLSRGATPPHTASRSSE